MPPWSTTLCNAYWHLRNLRAFDGAGRRRLYRRIADEKKRLIGSGVEAEEVRLLCRHLANPGNQNAEQKFRKYAAQMRLIF